MPALSDAEFQFVARETKSRSGLQLTPDKSAALDMRLTALARREGFFSPQEMITTARARQDDRLLWLVADALTISETAFFRDKAQFTALREQILPELARQRGASVRVLSAGCSTGQEPYSIAMMLDEMRQTGRTIACEIVAADISARALEKARAGLYSQFEVQRGLPIALLVRHFEKTADLWRISDRMRAAVKLQRANLLHELSKLGKFDVILCRNVLSSFDGETRADVMAQLTNALAQDGYLLIGAGESAPEVNEAFAPSPLGAGILTHRTAARAAA